MFEGVGVFSTQLAPAALALIDVVVLVMPIAGLRPAIGITSTTTSINERIEEQPARRVT